MHNSVRGCQVEVVLSQGPVKVVWKPDSLVRDGEFFDLAGLQG